MILVVGDAILDVDRRFTTTRRCPENDDAPVLTPLHRDTEMRLGGAVNVWASIQALGAPCGIISVVGNDQSGELIKSMTAGQSAVMLMARTPNPTTVKERIYVDGVLRFRMDNDRQAETPNTLEHLETMVCDQIREGAVHMLVLSDYGKGVLAAPQRMIACAQKYEIPVIVDPKGTDWKRYAGATVIKPNYLEEISHAGDVPCEYELVTLGDKGMVLYTEDYPKDIWGITREVVDVTGAGDMACAALAVCMHRGFSPYDAARVANVLAGWSVEFHGVKTFTRQEATDECARHGIHFPQ